MDKNMVVFWQANVISYVLVEQKLSDDPILMSYVAKGLTFMVSKEVYP